jgi:hypothetical protein
LHGVAAKPYKASKFEKAPQKIVAKQVSARYTPEAKTWVKIKNREHSQAVGGGFLRPAKGSGEMTDEARIAAWLDALKRDPHFSGEDLPLTSPTLEEAPAAELSAQ